MKKLNRDIHNSTCSHERMRIFEEQEISRLMCQRPHLFILGAGATKATIPNGDKYGLQSPVMDDFMKGLNIENLLNGVNLQTKSKNIEEIYSELYERPDCADVVKAIEDRIISHYQHMQIPDVPTLYDFLILSLRKKDCIATFNWDPLLIQAYNRINKLTKDLPELLFLHGCVAAGLCEECKYYTPLKRQVCPKCGRKLTMSQLLFPIKQKDYTQNIFIHHNWNTFEDYLERACLISIWGYSAPNSDVEAKKNMLKAFSSQFRKLDQIELINIAEESILYKTWQPFIKETNYHVHFHKTIMDSFIAEFPRRSVEGYVKRYMEGWWNDSKITLKECNTFDELAKLVEPLLQNEQLNNYNVII